MDQARNIREHMPVMCSSGDQIGTVDRIEGNTIKLTKEQGQHHWIPMDWVKQVDQHVHLNRGGDQVRQAWMSSPPQMGAMGGEQEAIPL